MGNQIANMPSDDWMAEFEKQRAREAPIIERLMAADPKLPFITAMIMAGDIRQGEDAWAELEAGNISYREANTRVGSFAALDFHVRAYEAGLCDEELFYEMWPEEWSGSDPDDTDPRFLVYWLEAWKRNGNQTVLLGDPLPEGDTLVVYRGQDEGAPFGIAWTLDRKVAEKFANGAATREAHRGGVVVLCTVKREDILGYITDRGESEVIVNPTNLRKVGEM